jgi:hypothetical protein
METPFLRPQIGMLGCDKLIGLQCASLHQRVASFLQRELL